MTTFSGLYVNPWQITPEEIKLEDIAQGLSNLCRFAGQCVRFYSIAQHSVLVAEQVLLKTESEQMALIGLFHDAPEAYVCDLVRCVKKGLPDYRDLEYGIWIAVIDAFKLEPLLSLIEDGEEADLPAVVKEADMRMLVTERRELISEKSAVWDLQKEYQPYDMPIEVWDPITSRAAFFNMYQRLTGKTQ